MMEKETLEKGPKGGGKEELGLRYDKTILFH